MPLKFSLSIKLHYYVIASPRFTSSLNSFSLCRHFFLLHLGGRCFISPTYSPDSCPRVGSSCDGPGSTSLHPSGRDLHIRFIRPMLFFIPGMTVRPPKDDQSSAGNDYQSKNVPQRNEPPEKTFFSVVFLIGCNQLLKANNNTTNANAAIFAVEAKVVFDPFPPITMLRREPIDDPSTGATAADLVCALPAIFLPLFVVYACNYVADPRAMPRSILRRVYIICSDKRIFAYSTRVYSIQYTLFTASASE